MPGRTCPVCGDPNAFPLWVDDTPPGGCPHDDAWHAGRPRSIRTVAECPYQRSKAWAAAEFRRLVPDAFDHNGNIRPGEAFRVLMAFAKAHPDKPL